MEQDDQFHKTIVDNLNDGVYYVDRDRTITYWNRGAERLTGFGVDDVVGHHCYDNLLMHMDEAGTLLCLDGCPLQASMHDGQARETQVYLHHKDGHRQPVNVRTAPIRDAEGAIVGAVEIFNDAGALVEARRQAAALERLALLDELTGLGNRRYVEMRLQARVDEWTRYGWTFGVLMVDVDHFKVVNDSYGHAVGDAVLQMVARTIEHAARGADVVGRWGGEEFLVVLAHVDGEGLAATAERLRLLVRESQLPRDREGISVTVSVGGTLVQPGDGRASVLERADALLYRSKLAGRDQVTLDTTGG